MATENSTRKSARWFPSDSRNNEGMMADYSNKVKEMLKVLDFIQFGGPECTVLRTFRWEVLI